MALSRMRGGRIFSKILRKSIILERARNTAVRFLEHAGRYYIARRREKCRDINTTKMEETIMYFDAIAKIVAERTGCDVSAVKPESKFSELGIDSLDTVELLMNLEDEIGIEIELDEKVETIDDLDKFIQSKKG